MESNEQTELTSKKETDSQMESRLMALAGGGVLLETLSQKEQKVMDLDISSDCRRGGCLVEVKEGMEEYW